MSKLLANQISNYNDNGPVEAKDGINVANGKPLQVAGAAGTSGQYLTSTGSSVAWTTFPTIPAAQVNADWNATSGVAQISNKPTLHAVATSGQYSDLSGLPSIPAAQIQSDWNVSNTSAVDFIKNKPTLFSGAYNDLTGKPTIPSNLGDLANVASTAPNNNEVLKWNGSNWAPATDASGGGTFTSLTDTPANFTSQAGKYLKVNAGATALEYVTLPVDPDTNTTYSQASVADGSNVKLRLTDSGSTNDDILITAGNNITISSVTAGGFTIASTGGSGSSTFAALTDTPANFTGAATKTVVVNSAGNALEFVDSGTSSNEIIPVAYAHVTADSAGTGTGMTWGAYNSSNGRMEFTFGTALSDANYYVLSEREQYDTHSVHISQKTTTGFRATWYGNDGTTPLAPSIFGGVLIVYASTPTRSVGAGAGALPTASATVLGGIKVGTNLSINGSGVLSASGGEITVQEEGSSLATAATTLNFVGTNVTATGTGAVKTITITDSGATTLGALTDVDTTGAANTKILKHNGTSWVVGDDVSGTGLQARGTSGATSTSLANNAAGNLTIVAAKTYSLLKIQTSHAAWVTLYTDTTSRTNDAARSETTDPLPGSGVLAEVITSDGATQIITPGLIGWNNEGTPTTNAYVKVVNKSGSTADVTVTLHFVAIEA